MVVISGGKRVSVGPGHSGASLAPGPQDQRRQEGDFEPCVEKNEICLSGVRGHLRTNEVPTSAVWLVH